MAEEQKPVEVVQEQIAAAVATEAPAVETTAVTAEETKPVEAAAVAETAAPAEEKKEVKPVEEGHLGHKAQGAAFPKNLIASKQFFFFGNDALEAKALEAYKKSEKAAESALNNIAWAAHTGKGLLFAGDKKAPTHVINLAHATEPETEGSNKFVLTANGSKHSFKAANAAERDNWVSQIKAKIAEAKELATSVTESDVYKNTLESFKPAPKEEKATEAAKEEATEEAKPEEAAAVAAAVPEETQAVKEEPKRRSASRKRASIFGFGKKDVLPKDEVKAEEAAPAVASEETAAATEEVAPAAETVAATDAAATEETTEAAAEAPVKPTANKRNSFFGGLLAKKEKKAAEPKAEEAIDGEAAVTEDAPVIPPVETSTPLAEAVNNAETTVNDTAADVKKDVKEKRKSSLPFAFGKRDKSPVAAAEGEEKPASKSAFSKLRATIKGKGASPKADAAAAAETVKEEGAAAGETAAETAETATEEASKAIDNAAVTASDAVENAPEKINNATPAVTAAA